VKQIRKLLLKILGLAGYYRLVSRVYIFMVSAGFWKKKYPEIFFLKKLIKPGFSCIDIGANMGYYSFFLSRYCGEKGKVYSVEPVPLFAQVFKRNISRTGINNVELLPYALGEKNQQIKMGTPLVDGVIHHGMTRIVNAEKSEFEQYYNAEMRIPDELFRDIQRLDFIKCDVEGYEHYVFSNMTGILRKFKPVIQAELSDNSGREKLIELFISLGYKGYRLGENDNLIPLEKAGDQYPTDYYFLNQELHSYAK
jgi:FkbM family methyltransferase